MEYRFAVTLPSRQGVAQAGGPRRMTVTLLSSAAAVYGAVELAKAYTDAEVAAAAAAAAADATSKADAAQAAAEGTAATALAAHVAALDPHPQYETSAEAQAKADAAQAAAEGTAATALAAHVAAPDPHPQYETSAEAQAKADAAQAAAEGTGATALAAHVAAPDPHPQYETSAEAQAKADAAQAAAEGTAATALAAHVAAPDPHPQYETSAEAQAKADAAQTAAEGTAATGLAAHVAALDPHPQYETSAEAQAKANAAQVAALSSAQVYADIGLSFRVRFDSDQSIDSTQKRIARRNIGFNDSFTVAELQALPATESAKLRVAYCSDCLSSQAWNNQQDSGALCLWNGIRWVTTCDNIGLHTDFALFAIEYAAINPSGQWWGRGFRFFKESVQAGGFTSLQIYNSGSNSGYTTFQAADEGYFVRQTAGSTATGSSKAVLNAFMDVGSSNFGKVRAAFVIPFGSGSMSTANDRHHFRYSLETSSLFAGAAAAVNMFSWLFDDYNVLGFGASNNLRVVLRQNSSTVASVDSGVAVTVSTWLALVIEPLDATMNSRNCRYRAITSPNGRGSFTTVLDVSNNLSSEGSVMAASIVGKNLGANILTSSRRPASVISARYTDRPAMTAAGFGPW